MDDLETWLPESYPRAFRTACLILRSPTDADEAVQEAFLRVWRFRAAIPAGEARRAWLYRAVVTVCLRRLHAGTGGDGAAGRAADCDLTDDLWVPVVLRYYAALSEREIALAIRRRPATVAARLAEARRRLADAAVDLPGLELEVAP